MKKFYSIVFAFMLAFAITAYGTDETHETSQLGQPQFLEDLEYMLHVLENNFALFDVAYWAHGANIPEIVENVRDAIISDPTMDVDGFFDVLFSSFVDLRSVGHFGIITPELHHEFVSDRFHWRWNNSPSTRRRYTLPHVLAFYEPRHPGAELETTTMRLDAGDLQGIDLDDFGLQEFILHANLFGFEAEVSQFLAAIELGEYEEAAALGIQIFEMILDAEIPPVTTDIIETGKIAYLGLNSSWWLPAAEARSDHGF